VALSGCDGNRSFANLTVVGNLSATDLRVLEPVPPAAIAAGHEVKLAITLQATVATEYIPVSFYLVNKADLDTNLEEPRTYVIGHGVYYTPPVGSSTHETWLNVPPEIAPGGEWVLMSEVDPLDVVDETNETDNEPQNGPSTVVIVDTTMKDRADLVLESAQLDSKFAVANEAESKRKNWSKELAQKLNYKNVRAPHFGINATLSTSGSKQVNDVPVAVALAMPDELNLLDPRVEGRVFPTPYPVPSAFRTSIPLAIWDGAKYVNHKDPGGGFRLPVLRPGDAQSVHLGIAFPENILQDLNAFIVGYKSWVTKLLPEVKIAYMQMTGESLPSDAEVKAWYLEQTGQQLATLELTVRVTVNIDKVIPEWENGRQRVAKQRAGGDDNAAFVRVNVFERRDDQISNTKPVSLSKDFSKGFTAEGLSLDLKLSSGGGMDKTGANADSKATLPLGFFGKPFELVSLEAKAKVDPRASGRVEYSVDIKFLNQVVFTKFEQDTGESAKLEWTLFEKNFLDDEKNKNTGFLKTLERDYYTTIGPVPVPVLKFSFEVGGTLGFEGKLTLTLQSLSFEVAPLANFKVGGAAALSVFVADAGVRGDVTLIEVKVPVTVKATLDRAATTKDQLNGVLDFTVGLELSGPTGEFSLFVKFPLLTKAKVVFGKWFEPKTNFLAKFLPELKWPFWKFTTVKLEVVLVALQVGTTIELRN